MQDAEERRLMRMSNTSQGEMIEGNPASSGTDDTLMVNQGLTHDYCSPIYSTIYRNGESHLQGKYTYVLNWEDRSMHLYWRIIEELKYLGECWTINDPSLLRYYENWVRKNAKAITLGFEEDLTTFPTLFTYKDIPFSLN